MPRRTKPGPVVAVLVAAGEGRRSGLRVPKQFHRIAGRTLLEHVLGRIDAHPQVNGIVLVAPGSRLPSARRLASTCAKVLDVVPGGARRQDSVARGLDVVPREPGTIVLVHDAARPLVPPGLISSVIRETRRSGAAAPGILPSDTVKEVTAAGSVRKTLDRGRLRLIQTPQGARLDWLLEAYLKVGRRFLATDEASLLEAAGRKVKVVEGSTENFKVTTAADLARLESLIRKGG